jgi:hypothetical protein
VVRIRLPASGLPPEEFEAFLNYIDGLFTRGQRFALVLDVRDAPPIDPARRKSIAEHSAATNQRYPSRCNDGVMTGVSREGCLARRLVKSLGAGRCPKEELAMAQRHLSECARCRAAVVAAATGLRGPGETVVMMRRASASAPAGVKVAAVLMSLLVAGWAWGYDSAPKASEPSGATQAGDGAAQGRAAPSDRAAAVREATPSQSLEKLAPALPLELPAAQDGVVLTGSVQDGAG